eukprot:100687_1
MALIIMLSTYMALVQFFSRQMDYFSQPNLIITVPIKHDGCACLNRIFDQIFVISIKPRHDTLSLTLHQLNEEHIRYTVWEGHSSTNPYSLQVFKRFRHNIDAKNHSRWFEPFFPGHKRYNTSTLYYNKNAFFLRQTQIDILKYSLMKNLKQILIFEDDIVLANPSWINMFCDVFPSIRRWHILNIGVNQEDPKERIPYFMSFLNHSDVAMKYYLKNIWSFGTFGIAFHADWFEELIDLYDIESERVNCFPLDQYLLWYPHSVKVRNRAFNIHPTLVLPDVTTSTMRGARKMNEFIHNHTTDQDASHFTKYWSLRFSNESEKLSHIRRISATMPSFEELVRDSPSKTFLKKEYLDNQK